jgi:aspartate carbamoyltransferase catalytic subunit
MMADVIVLRHPYSGACHMMAGSEEMKRVSIINAGDGMHAHPTQALLDLMTVREKKNKLDGLNVAIVGDIAHSRVARSNVVGFTKMGANVTVAGPATMIPPGIEALGAKVETRLDDAVEQADVIMMLRIQKERLQRYAFSTEREYARFYGLNPERLRRAKKDVLIMHPGPINRGVEIDPSVADGPCSIILDQVTNGVAVRMALLYLVLGRGEHGDVD